MLIVQDPQFYPSLLYSKTAQILPVSENVVPKRYRPSVVEVLWPATTAIQAART